MKVLFLSNHCCIRVVKQGIALTRSGVEVTYLQHHFPNDDTPYLIAESDACFYKNGSQLQAILRERTDKFDLIHVHNEPHALGSYAKKFSKKPVIFDAHDLDTTRNGRECKPERDAIECADGIITPSQGYITHVRDWYKIPEDFPIMCVYSFCTHDMVMKVSDMPRMGGVVYEGGASIVTDDMKRNGVYSYRDWRDASREFYRIGIPFVMFCADPSIGKAYLDTGAAVMMTIPYTAMLNNLSRFDWGMVGCPWPDRTFEAAMPNKMFEYLAAGVPSIVMNAPEASEFAEEHGIGVTVRNVKEIKKVYDKHEEFRKNCLKKRKELLMETQTNDILNFYRTVLDRANG